MKTKTNNYNILSLKNIREKQALNEGSDIQNLLYLNTY